VETFSQHKQYIRTTVVTIASIPISRVGRYGNIKPPADVTAKIATGLRLVDISVESFSPSYLFTAVNVANSGSYAKGWWWYVNASPATVSNLLATNNARLVDLDIDSTTGNLNVIMVSCAFGCPFWWWYYGISTSQLLNIAAQDGARIPYQPKSTSMCRRWDPAVPERSVRIVRKPSGLPIVK
jgi:hypothetical protein